MKCRRHWIRFTPLCWIGVVFLSFSPMSQSWAARAEDIARALADSRLDPRLKSILKWQESGRAAPSEFGLADDANLDGNERTFSVLITGLVRTSDLIAAGAQPQTQAGGVTTARIAAHALPGLLQLPGLTGIEAAGTMQTQLDVSVGEIGARDLWGGLPPSFPPDGLTGRNVVVGIVDTGIDLGHADFRKPTNATRILYVWDQGASGTPPAEFSYGVEYTAAQINAGGVGELDTSGHGTYVAGIAAGNGRATGNGRPAYQYVGVAPEGDIIVVKCDPPTESGVIDGANYVFQKAAALGKPAVVLVGSGTHKGAHDGTAALDMALSALVGPGKIIVAPVGNDGGKGLHARLSLANGATGSIELAVPTHMPAPSDFFEMQCWHESSALFQATLRTPRGYAIGPILSGNSSGLVDTPDGSVIVDNDQVMTIRGARLIRATVLNQPAGVGPAAGHWRLDVQRTAGAATSPLDAWVSQWSMEPATPGTSPEITTGLDPNYLIRSPATGDSILAVAAYTTKKQWVSLLGNTEYYPENPVLSDLAAFSSPGPRRDQVLRPEITAPGQGVFAALSSQASSLAQTEFVVQDGVHVIQRGTSVAAAHAAGGVALLLEENPAIRFAMLRSMLREMADPDAFTGTTPNTWWGYGKLQLYEMLVSVEDQGSSLVGLRLASPVPARGRVDFDVSLSHEGLVRSPAGISLVIVDVRGREVAKLHAASTTEPQRLTWDGLDTAGRRTPSGVYFARIHGARGSGNVRFVCLR